MTAEELLSQLAQDPSYQRLRAAQDERVKRAEAEQRAEQAVLIADLSRVGLDVESVWDLVNSSDSYAEAIPILIDHLVQPYSAKTKEGIARALAVPDATAAWGALLGEFNRDPDTSALGAKFGLACALAVVGHCAGRYDELLQLLRDPRHGESRIALLDALSWASDAEVRGRLAEFVADPVLGNAARSCMSDAPRHAP